MSRIRNDLRLYVGKQEGEFFHLFALLLHNCNQRKKSYYNDDDKPALRLKASKYFKKKSQVSGRIAQFTKNCTTGKQRM